MRSGIVELRNVEASLDERGIANHHETARLWWGGPGSIIAPEIR